MTKTYSITGSGSSTATLKIGPKIFVTVNAVPFSVWPTVKFILKASLVITVSNAGQAGRRLLESPDEIVPASRSESSQDIYLPETDTKVKASTRRRRGSTSKATHAKETCIEGTISAGGTTSVSIPNPADTADMICRAAVQFTCNHPAVRAANCIAKGFGVDPCAKAADLCTGMSQAIAGAMPSVAGKEMTFGTPDIQVFKHCDDVDTQ